ncbi:MAG TPA: DMT family transporter [Sediminibacterium sp.]|nr:DMT family transporter [Sediminibacterium sp.]
MKKALIQLHLSVFLAGFTGILGKLISLPEMVLVWYRMLLTALILGVLQITRTGKPIRLQPKEVFQLLGIGSLIALHWVCFYGSIKLANVSVGLVCFAAVGVFTSMTEPLMTHKPFSWPELLLGTLSLFGIYLIFHFDSRFRTGILLGILSALLAAVFSVLNKRIVNLAAAQRIMQYEMSGGLFLLTVLMPFYLHATPGALIFPSLPDWCWLLVLSGLCTVIAMELMLQSLRKLSAFTQTLTLNLEPVYGIVLAFFLFHENRELNRYFYIGFACIGISVLWQMYRVVRYKRL